MGETLAPPKRAGRTTKTNEKSENGDLGDNAEGE